MAGFVMPPSLGNRTVALQRCPHATPSDRKTHGRRRRGRRFGGHDRFRQPDNRHMRGGRGRVDAQSVTLKPLRAVYCPMPMPMPIPAGAPPPSPGRVASIWMSKLTSPPIMGEPKFIP